MVTKRIVAPVVPQITAWSYSRLNDYRGCPQKAKYKFIDKLKEPGSKAMDRGSDIHKMAEKFARGNAKTACPPELECFEDEFRQVQKIKTALVEQQWAFNSKWEKTGWFDADAWCRVVVDLAFTGTGKMSRRLNIVDHKTGKLNPDHLGQLGLYALAGLLLYPADEIDEVNVQLWYLDPGIILPEEPMIFTHADVPALKKEWETKVKSMLADRKFPPKPSNACGWCHFSKGKGGPCKF
jgi:hypothetical protein